MIGLPRQPRRIKLRHGGVTVEPIMGSEIKERRFGITRDGAPYPPIQSVDANLNFSQAGKSAAPSPTQFRNQCGGP
jgi:hypothetical protein